MRLWNLDRVKNELLFNCNSPVHVAKENLNKKQTDLDYLISLLYCCCPMVLLWKAVRALRCGELKPFVIHFGAIMAKLYFLILFVSIWHIL